MEKNMKSIKKQFSEHGVFYTDDKLAKMLYEYIDNNPKTVYDPTCGQGNLLAVVPNEVEKYGQELYEEELEKAKNKLSNFTGKAGDTLLYDYFRDKKFDAIVANYPFSVKWDPDLLKDDERFKQCPVMAPKSKADFAFILHMLSHINDDGVIATLCPHGVLFRGQREAKIRQWLIENNYIDRIVSVPGGHFVDTKIPTVIIVFKKKRKTTDIIFSSVELDKERTVTLDEIKKNDYNLNFPRYLEQEIEEEEIDIRKIHKELEELDVKIAEMTTQVNDTLRKLGLID